MRLSRSGVSWLNQFPRPTLPDMARTLNNLGDLILLCYMFTNGPQVADTRQACSGMPSNGDDVMGQVFRKR